MQKALVKQVLSGDSLVLRAPASSVPNQLPPEKTVAFSSIAAPRLKLSEPGSFESRDFLRRLCVGKPVTFKITHKPNSGRELAVVTLASGEDLQIEMIKSGWAKVKENSQDDENWNKLLAIQDGAKGAGLGLWGKFIEKTVVTTLEDPKAFLEQHKGQEIKAIVDQVRDGATLRLIMLLDDVAQYATVHLSGIRAPQLRASEGATAEPHAEEAKFFVESRLLQREITIILEGISNQNLVGTVRHPNGNIAQLLAQNGLVYLVDWSLSLCTDGPFVLRAAEKAAKEKRVRIWKDYVPKKLPDNVEQNFEAQITRIANADTLLAVSDRTGKEYKLRLASIKKADDQRQSGYAHEAREFLRKKLIGKTADVHVDYVKPAEDEYEEKTCATVTIKNQNVSEALVVRGLATVVRHRKGDDDRSSQYDKLVAAEQKAIQEQKGIHSGKELQHTIRDISESAQRAKSHLNILSRAGRIPAVVDYVSSGGRFKIWIPKDSVKLTLVLGGIVVPRLARNERERGEKWAKEAAELSTKKCLQRDVEIQIDGTDRVGGFIGSLWIKDENLAHELLKQGFASVHEYTTTAQMQAMQKEAQSNNLGIWSEVAKPETITKLETSVIITDVKEQGEISYQVVEEAQALDKLMTDFAAFHIKNQGGARPKIGELCSAKFTADDSWYRARVLKYEGIQCQRETIPVTRLRILPGEFGVLKPQARHSKLAYIKIAGGQYSVEAMERLKELVEGRELAASIDNNEVLLKYNKDDSVTDSVNADLVRDGYALVVGSSELVKLEQNAREKHYGMWEYGDVSEE